MLKDHSSEKPRVAGHEVDHGGHQRRARLSKALKDLPRHLFFPSGVNWQTPDDQSIPFGRGRVIPPVQVVAMMLGALDLEGTERVLEIGGGSGYQAALLGRLAREVVSVDDDEELVNRAASLLAELGENKVRLIHADAFAGFPEAAPYQAILVDAAVPELPATLLGQLDVGGRLVVPLGDAEAQLVERHRKERFDSLDSRACGSCRLHLLRTPRTSPSSFPWTRYKR
jgi:protein-L-isoaspartate(D-aspartate) O-methyltransferase